MKHSMHLAALLADIVDTGVAADCLINGLNLDSRSIVAGARDWANWQHAFLASPPRRCKSSG